MGAFRWTRISGSNCEFVTMGTRLRALPLPLAAAIVALAAASPAWAQGSGSGAPDQPFRRYEEEKKLEKEAPAINIEDHQELKRDNDSKVRFKLNKINIVGNVTFSTDELHALVAELEGREISIADLRSAARKITIH